MSAALTRLSANRSDDVTSVFFESFRDYPVMRYVVGQRAEDFDDRLRDLIDFFVFRRVVQGGPLLGMVDEDGRVLAAAMMTLPVEPDRAAEVAARRDAMWRCVGDEARIRHEAYSRITKTFAIDPPHHHLNMIGVRPEYAGRGLARPLLEAAAQLAMDDPHSCGVSLTTEVRKNLALYEHFGYGVVGHARVSPELETWGLFLATGVNGRV
jgi:GNAT superfamily N-acetyltransferase